MKNNPKNMTIPERNEYVEILIGNIKNGDTESKLKLFDMVVKIFRAKTFNDKISFMKDLEQDLWFNYEKALKIYNHTSPFLSFIHNEFRDLYTTNLQKYEQVVQVPKYAQKVNNMSKAKIFEIDSDTFDKNVILNDIEQKITNDLIKYQMGILIKDLKEIEKDKLFMYFGIGYDEKYTYEEIGVKYGVTREAIRQSIDKIITKLKTKN